MDREVQLRSAQVARRLPTASAFTRLDLTEPSISSRLVSPCTTSSGGDDFAAPPSSSLPPIFSGKRTNLFRRGRWRTAGFRFAARISGWQDARGSHSRADKDGYVDRNSSSFSASLPMTSPWVERAEYASACTTVAERLDMGFGDGMMGETDCHAGSPVWHAVDL